MKTLTATIISVLALMLTACGGNDEDKPERDEAAYIDWVQEDPVLSVVSATSLVELAEATCDYFDRGNSSYDAAGIIMDEGFDAITSAYLISGIQLYMCPEHEDA